MTMLPLQQSKVICVAKNVPIFFENSNLRNFLVPPLLILNEKRIVLILAMYENTAPGPSLLDSYSQSQFCSLVRLYRAGYTLDVEA